MKTSSYLQKCMLVAVGLTFALAQSAYAQSANANGIANANALNAKHHAGAAKAARPVFESDGTAANDAALGKFSAQSVSLPDIPKVKTHGKHKVSHGPVGPDAYSSSAQPEIRELR